jgi:hypothetical protein
MAMEKVSGFDTEGYSLKRNYRVIDIRFWPKIAASPGFTRGCRRES